MVDLLRLEWRKFVTVIVLVWLGVFIYLVSHDGLTLLQLVVLSFIFGLISGFTSLMNAYLFDRFIRNISGSQRTIITFAWNILTIALFNYLFVLYLDNRSFDLEGFFTLLGITMLIGVIPIMGVELLEKNDLLNFRIKETTPVIDHLADAAPKASTRWTIKLNKSDARNINVESLLYVESQKNYLTFYLENDKSFQIRFTLKQLEESFSDFDYLVRCHRSFLVNMKKISQVIPSNNGYTITLDGQKSLIPVSKTYISQLKDWASKEGTLTIA